MEIKSRFDHFNINVTDLERSIAFYGKALGLKEHHRKEASDGSFILVYLTDDSRSHPTHKEPYDLSTMLIPEEIPSRYLSGRRG